MFIFIYSIMLYADCVESKTKCFERPPTLSHDASTWPTSASTSSSVLHLGPKRHHRIRIPLLLIPSRAFIVSSISSPLRSTRTPTSPTPPTQASHQEYIPCTSTRTSKRVAGSIFAMRIIRMICVCSKVVEINTEQVFNQTSTYFILVSV